MTTDYDDYEAYFRGSLEAKEGRKEELLHLYLQVRDRLGGAIENWLDIGCGEGNFLQVLHGQGVSATGIELDAELAKQGREAGYDVFCGDALTSVERMVQEGRRFQVVSLLHLIEHMETNDAVELLRLISHIQSPKGCCVVQTPNVKDRRVLLESFYRDPTHLRPYPPRLIEYLMKATGYPQVESLEFDRWVADREESIAEVRAERKRKYDAIKRLLRDAEEILGKA